MRHNVLGPLEVHPALSKSYSFTDKDVKMTMRSINMKRDDSPRTATPKASNQVVLERSVNFRNWDAEEPKLQSSNSFKNIVKGKDENESIALKNRVYDALPSPTEYLQVLFSSPRPLHEFDAAAVKLQKVYKSYRTRRNLADCAVVVEELWWKALEFASLKQSSVCFFNVEKHETPLSRWARARTRVAKVGKGLLKDEKAQKLALRHWLEAIDPRHRYGHNLHLYYDVWFESESTQPFFYWLDIGNGREVNLEKCPRNKLQSQCIKYLGPNEREAYEVIVENGRLAYKQSGELLNTSDGSKWIFVLSTSRSLYVGEKKKGNFQHSSFLAGGATTSAGRLVAQEGILIAIWPYSGHYLPTEENFKEFISFLQENNVDLTTVKRCSIDDDNFPSFRKEADESVPETEKTTEKTDDIDAAQESNLHETEIKETQCVGADSQADNHITKMPSFKLARKLSCKWTTGVGPRIGCVRDYPADLQCRALEQVNLSPRVIPSPNSCKAPIPSPRPSPKIRLSPRLQYMGIPSPRVNLTLPDPKRR